MNVVNLIGRMVKDPELKFGQNGKEYMRFSLAVKRPFSKDDVDYINCVAFGKTAEILSSYTKKGHQVGIEGNLRMNQYEKDGKKMTTFEVVVNNISLIESKKTGDNTSVQAPKNEPIKREQKPTEIEGFSDDEFPF